MKRYVAHIGSHTFELSVDLSIKGLHQLETPKVEFCRWKSERDACNQGRIAVSRFTSVPVCYTLACLSMSIHTIDCKDIDRAMPNRQSPPAAAETCLRIQLKVYVAKELFRAQMSCISRIFTSTLTREADFARLQANSLVNTSRKGTYERLERASKYKDLFLRSDPACRIIQKSSYSLTEQGLRSSSRKLVCT